MSIVYEVNVVDKVQRHRAIRLHWFGSINALNISVEFGPASRLAVISRTESV